MIQSTNHWWQNWSKTHAFVAERMFFPKSVGDIATAILMSEAAQRPVRAVGGGWSLSEASLPGQVRTSRPNVRGVEAIAKVLPHAQRFPTLRSAPSIASVTPLPTPDLPGSMVMVDMGGKSPQIANGWSYQGADLWLDPSGRPRGATVESSFIDWLAKANLRPARNPGSRCIDEADVPGSLAMLDLSVNAAVPNRDWFYHGGGVWTVGVSPDSGRKVPDEGNLNDLYHQGRLSDRSAKNLSIRAADPADGLSLLLARAPYMPAPVDQVHLINTRSLVSSLQQNLSGILSQSALDATSAAPPSLTRRFLFHVEAGITMAELGQLLAHQSPRLSLQVISGSPGATLAGALATATHGAEFKWPLLIDAVKAVHLVGPGGKQWWIEGDEPIADPAKLRAAYPDIDPSRIIQGTAKVAGVVPQDWLGAAVVNLGCLGVLYSVVLEVVPLFGVREVVVQKTWRGLGTLSQLAGDLPALLRDPDPAIVKATSRRIVSLMTNGSLSGTGIGLAENQYANLAINPIPRVDGDFDCWVANREVTQELPIDTQPAVGLIDGATRAFDPDHVKMLGVVFGVPDVVADPPLAAATHIANNFRRYKALIGRVLRATDLFDAALDTALSPMSTEPGGTEVAQTLITGILSGQFNTANCDKRSDLTGVSVGNLGFPASGIMGTAIEIALSPDDAFGFLQTEILDRVTKKNLYGYISIRLCSKTRTLLGMPQYGDGANPCSVMIEVVGFGDTDGRGFIKELQGRTLRLIKNGLDAMLHWAFENEEVTAAHLAVIPAVQALSRSGMSKLTTFKTVRSRLHAAAPNAFPVFDSAFTARLGLSSSGSVIFADERGNSISHWVPEAYYATAGTPLIENYPQFLKHLNLVNRSGVVATVEEVSIASSADAPGAPAFELLAPLPPFDIFDRALEPVFPLTFQYKGTAAGPVTGTVVVDCDRPLGQTLTIDFSANVIANRHAELRASPPVLDFGSTSVGADYGEYLTLVVSGPYGALVETLSFEGEQPAGQFAASALLPFGVGQGHTLYVSYRPTVRGPAQAKLVIGYSSKTDIGAVTYTGRLEVPLSAEAHAPELVITSSSLSMAPLTTLDLGVADPGKIARASFWVRNGGDASLVIQGPVFLPNSAHSVPDVTIFPATVPPGDTFEIPCEFLAPQIPGTPVTSLLHLLTNDPRQVWDGNVGDLTLKGQSSGGRLSNPGEAQRLGTQPPLQTSASLVFASDGNIPVNIKEIRLAHPNDFSVNAPLTPAQMAPGSSLTITATLTATNPGSYQNTLMIVHDGRGNVAGGTQVLLMGTVD